MKIIYAIVSSDDGNRVTEVLNEHQYMVTKLATTGGFLKAGNVTILAGLEEDRLDEAFSIIREHCRKRKQILPTTTELGMGFYPAMPVQVDVGGATVFVLDVERFEKL